MPDRHDPQLVDIIACAIHEELHGDSDSMDLLPAPLAAAAIARYQRAARAALDVMPSQTPQDATYGTNTTQPEPECPPATIAPQNGTQGRNEWAAGYAAARRFYGDTAPLALYKIRARLDQYTDMYGGRNSIVPGGVISDLYAILDTAQEPHQ